jgi:hypothetical protein
LVTYIDKRTTAFALSTHHYFFNTTTRYYIVYRHIFLNKLYV